VSGATPGEEPSDDPDTLAINDPTVTPIASDPTGLDEEPEPDASDLTTFIYLPVIKR
jgi:hypothetical protein